MKTFTIEVTDRELEMIHNVLKRGHDDLIGYTRWIDDRPMLPGREDAIGLVRAEAVEHLVLSARLYDVRKGRGS